MGSNCFSRDTLESPKETESEENVKEMSRRIAEKEYKVDDNNEVTLLNSFIDISMRMKSDVRRESRVKNLPLFPGDKEIKTKRPINNSPNIISPSLVQRSVSMRGVPQVRDKTEKSSKLKKDLSRIIE